ncbi:PKD domain-containing protein [Arthrobacter sp. R4-81]
MHRPITNQPGLLYGRSETPRWLVALWSVVAAALCAGFLALVPPSPAAAVQPGTQNVVVSANAKRGTPHVLDGYVAGFAQVGDLTVATGNFTRVRNDSSTTEIARTHIFAFTSANTITSLNVAVSGEIMDVLAVGDGKHVWIAGSFNTVNGATARGLAKINVFTGQRDTSFAPPAFDGRVNQIRLRNGLLYLAGRFMKAGESARSLFAAVNPTTGALAPNVSLNISVPRKGALQMSRMDITPDGTRMVGIGNFTMANGQSRKQVLVADLTTSPTSLANWSTEGYAPTCNLVFDSYMRDVDISPDGKYFVIVTTGSYYADTLCDTAARFETGASGADIKPTWVDYTGGDTLTRVAVTQTTVYLGGHQRWLNNPFAADRVGPGAVERMGLAAVDVRNGLPLAWNPGRTRGYGVYSFVATDTGLWIGSDTDRISNFQYHGRLAFMPVAGGTPLLPDYPGILPGTVYLAGAATDDTGNALPSTSLIKRSFSGTAVTASSVMATSQPFGSMRGTFMIDKKLYSGRTDGTFRVQSFDGTTFGTATIVDQRGLTDFPVDVAKITGMFYDAATSRLYYTLSGDSRLFYRYFSTEINIIGAVRFVAPTNVAGPLWAGTRSLMLHGDSLYVADSTGTLKRWAWNANTAVAGGTPATVSGPTVDGKSWAATEAFMYAGDKAAPPPPVNQAPNASFTSTSAGLKLTVDGSGSSDPDGSIASHAWTFGDGGTATGATASRTYAAAGTYTVTLKVTDNTGATHSVSKSVTVTAANQPPVASFTAAVSNFTVNVNGSGSTDPDGTVASHAWAFGNGGTATGATASHTYATAGTYTITLTVTDNAGATNSKAQQVTVPGQTTAGSVTFRAASQSNTNSTAPAVAVPASAQVGDAMLLFATVNNTDGTVSSPTGITGWQVVGSKSQATIQSFLWARRVQTGDAGKTVTVPISLLSKTALQLVVYQGVTGPNWLVAQASEVDVSGTTKHTTPQVQAPSAGSTLVSYWAEKISASDTWTVTAPQIMRSTTVGSGGGAINSALSDTGPVGAGTTGGVAATAGLASTKVAMWSVVLQPGA